jgi:DNA-binding XRE family transcriptional regulator
MTEPTLSLGQRLRQRRWDELRLRQRDLAAAVGLSPGYLSQLEHDRARATEPTWRRLAQVLGLQEFALMRQAVAAGRLAPKGGHRGRADLHPLAPPPTPVPPAPPRTMPRTRWLTIAEAAAAIGMSPEAIRHLARTGGLQPAMRVHRPGEKGPPRWIVATNAVLAYRSPAEGYAKPPRQEPPAGMISLKEFARASGIAWATLYRRLEAQEIASVKRGRRRFIPATELARVLEAKRRGE